MASLGKFAGGIAHEINSPLVGIITGTDLLMVEIEELNEENLKETKDSLKENITIISESAKKSKDIILKLLKYSEKEEKKISEVSIKDTFEYLIDTMEDEFYKKNIVIAHEISEQLFVNGIKEDLITAFRNIIENSIYGLSHSEKEIKRINIYEDKNLKYKNIVIEDNGIGIEKEIINSVFDPFFTTKKIGEGMGLGLTVTYQIIMKHNFNIIVESVPNKWTKVIIDIS